MDNYVVHATLSLVFNQGHQTLHKDCISNTYHKTVQGSHLFFSKIYQFGTFSTINFVKSTSPANP